MEATAAAKNNPTIPEVAQRAKAYMAANKMTVTAFSSKVPYSRPTLSRYFSGKYDSDARELENCLTDYLDEHDPLQEPTPDMTQEPVLMEEIPENVIQSPVFLPRQTFESFDYRQVIGVCGACQQYARMGQIIGSSGSGKTYSLEQFAKLPQVAYVRCNAIMGHRDLVQAIERALGIPRTTGTITERVDGIVKFFEVNEGYLLLVDEADKLLNKNTQTKMDTLRDIYDKTRVGIVLAGEKALKNLISIYLDRMENRIVYHYDMVGLSAGELAQYMSGYDVEPAAMTELQRRAYGDRKSCFRLLDITLTNVFDLLGKTGSSKITADIIQQASSWMAL